RIVLSNAGLLNVALSEVGLGSNAWLETQTLAVPSMILVAAWRWTGVNIISFSSGLVNVPRDLYEAAALDGASSWRTFRSITLPMIPTPARFGLLRALIRWVP